MRVVMRTFYVVVSLRAIRTSAQPARDHDFDLAEAAQRKAGHIVGD